MVKATGLTAVRLVLLVRRGSPGLATWVIICSVLKSASRATEGALGLGSCSYYDGGTIWVCPGAAVRPKVAVVERLLPRNLS